MKRIKNISLLEAALNDFELQAKQHSANHATVNGIDLYDPDDVFMQCFDTEKEREQYMYMHSKGDTHYFKHIGTRKYITINKKIISTED